MEEEKEEEKEQIQENDNMKEFTMSNAEQAMDLDMTLSETDMEDHEL